MMSKNNMIERLVVLDVETSGPNFLENQLLSIAMVPISKNLDPIVLYIKHENIEWTDVGKKYFKSYEKEWSVNAILPSEACNKLAIWSEITYGGPFTIVAHNAAFDFAFLRSLFHANNVDESKVFSHRAIDTHSLLYTLVLSGKLPEEVITSSGAFKYFGIQPDLKKRHTAIGDAMATKELLLRILPLLDIEVLA